MKPMHFVKPEKDHFRAWDKFSQSRDFWHGNARDVFNPALSIIWKFRIQFFGESKFWPKI